MAKIVFGLATSHGPLLSVPADKWHLRAEDDRKNPAHPFRGETYDFDALRDLRAGENLEARITLAVMEERHKRCQENIKALGEKISQVKPDVVVMIGDDQHEWFNAEVMPSFGVYYGGEVINTALRDARKKQLTEALLLSVWANKPPEDRTYPGQPELALAIIAQAMADEFDVASLASNPAGPAGVIGLGHAFGFLYRRILNDDPIPCVPVLINTFYPPNQPSAKRCHDFGKSIFRAIDAWDSDKTVAVMASGGLSHFVVDEEFDRRILDALLSGNAEKITAEPEIMFRSGTSETKNWITAAGILGLAGLDMTLLDYVPCYRSEAGTGNAMAFATWS